MKRKSLIFDLVLFFLVICAGAVLVIYRGTTGAIDDTPLLPGQAGGEITVPVNIAEANRKTVEQVEINADNVQKVIESLSRHSSYRAEGQASYYYGATQPGVFVVKSWVRPDMSKIELYSQSGALRGLLKNTVLTSSHVYVWESGADTLYTGFAGDFSADDLGHMPTYETILKYPPENITGGGLDSELGIVTAETKNPQSGLAENWYIEINSGLLILYQCYEKGSLVCEARLTDWSAESIDDSVFLLPSGLMPE